ncbi:hypothetical protein [Sphingomonas aerophila]|uniref:Uncharacterized protein n=1 Tax=Sphingomonas aerophila TaxID=1344948 RepID=A0A7W9BFX5_9SPHN|nr:hypothetical protein [Sphingomonas aerophila]MBB5716126.1 hypothetical protein [Sphingomonas aerophila]
MTNKTEDAPNEIVAAVHEVTSRSEALVKAADRTKRWPLAKIGLGVGIGSAAIAGAVLFANRSKDGDKNR